MKCINHFCILIPLFLVLVTPPSISDIVTLNSCCQVPSTYENGQCIKLIQSGEEFQLERNATLKNFRFETYLPLCEEEEVIFEIDGPELIGQDDSDYDYVDVPAITNTGHLRYQESYYAPQDFCVLVPPTNEESLKIRICKPTCTERMACIPKCCLLNEVLEISTLPNGTVLQNCVAVKGKSTWRPIVYHDLETQIGHGDANYPVHIRLEVVGEWNMSECHQVALYTYKGPLKVDFRLLTNGEVMYRGINPYWRKLRGKFCIDGTADHDGQFSGFENDTVILNCFPRDEVSAGADYTQSKWYYSLMLVSAFFLFLTIIIYVLLWEKHTIHGFSLLSYFVALFLMQLGYVSVFILSEVSTFEGNNMRISFKCTFFAVFAHFAILHAFAWMTIVNFDLWCTFRTLKSSLTSGRGVKHYLKYLAFAVGLPSLIVSVALSLDLIFGEAMPYERTLIVPDYAKRKCYISNQQARLPYVVGPQTAFLLVNIFFFVSTVCALKEANEGTKLARRSTPTGMKNSPNRTQSYVVCGGFQTDEVSRGQRLMPLNFIVSGHFRVTLVAKLICVMGIPWVFEVISAAPALASPGDVGSNYVPWYWMVIDLMNHSQGIIIFIFFVCKRDILNSLRSKFPCLDDTCLNLSGFIPCFSSKACGARNATVLTVDSENDPGRPYALTHCPSGTTKSTKVESSNRSLTTPPKSATPLLGQKSTKF